MIANADMKKRTLESGVEREETRAKAGRIAYAFEVEMDKSFLKNTTIWLSKKMASESKSIVETALGGRAGRLRWRQGEGAVQRADAEGREIFEKT